MSTAAAASAVTRCLPSVYRTTFCCLDQVAACDPARQLLSFVRADGQLVTITAAGWRSQSRCVAAALLRRGVSRFTRAALRAPNGRHFCAAQLALNRLGAAAHMLQRTRSDSAYTLRYIRQQRLQVLITDDQHLLRAVHDDVDCGVELLVSLSDSVDQSERLVTMHQLEAEGAAMSHNDLDLTEQTVSSGDVAVVMMTSGSTGEPKSVPHTHEALTLNTEAVIRRLGLQDALVDATRDATQDATDDTAFSPAASTTPVRVFNDRPFSHSFGQVFGFGAALQGVPVFAGSDEVAMATASRDVTNLLRDISAQRCTHACLFGYQLSDMLGVSDGFDWLTLDGVRCVVTSGQPVGVALKRRVMSLLRRATVVDLYGSTETGIVSVQGISTRNPDHSLNTDHVIEPGSGTPLDGVEVRIASPDHPSQSLPVNTVGQLHVRGLSVTEGYLDNADTLRVAKDAAGWFNTGDLASISGEGVVCLFGRTGDAVKRAGLRVPTAEIESTLEDHPRVQQAACVGRADARLGQAVCACVVLSQGAGLSEEDLRAWAVNHLGIGADGLSLAPDYYVIMDKLPRTAGGKLGRQQLREIVATMDL